jgi:hypothetical protein
VWVDPGLWPPDMDLVVDYSDYRQNGSFQVPPSRAGLEPRVDYAQTTAVAAIKATPKMTKSGEGHRREVGVNRAAFDCCRNMRDPPVVGMGLRKICGHPYYTTIGLPSIN